MNLRILFPALLLSLSSLHAGSFGGPAPFRNGSPLPEGTDGRYQLVGTASNVTGIISFAIADGVQTASSADNQWVFFVDGQVLRGSTIANISQGKVAGILDSGIGSIPTNEDGTVDLPIAYIIPGNAASGSFSGKINLNSAVAAMEGNGEISGLPAREDQILLITGDNDTTFFGTINGVLYDIEGATYIPVVIPGSTLGNVDFKFRGTRLSQSTTSSSSTSSSSSN